jgi:hypothetical protein
MLNYKQILTNLSAIAYHHPQIMSFGFGDITQCTNDIKTKKEPLYTRMYVVPGTVTLNQNHIHYDFSIIIMDKVEDDLVNLNDVMSDTLETAKDIWTIFWQSYTAEQGNFSLELVGDWSPNIEPFTERFETILGGWTMNLSLSMPFDYNTCVIPIEFGFGFPEDQSFESYRVITKDFEKFADLHYQVNSFGFGSVQEMTNDIITKVEPKYPRMYIIPSTTRLDPNHMHISWNILVTDKLEEDYSNQQDVLSDTLEIVKDLFTKLYLSEYEADWDATVEPILENYETILCGWNLKVSIIQKFDYNRCVLPELPFVIPNYKWEDLAALWKDVAVKWYKI